MSSTVASAKLGYKYVPTPYDVVDLGVLGALKVGVWDAYQVLRRFERRDRRDKLAATHLVADVGTEKLGALLGLGGTRTREVVAELERLGWVRVVRDRGGPNRYLLGAGKRYYLLDWLDELRRRLGRDPQDVPAHERAETARAFVAERPRKSEGDPLRKARVTPSEKRGGTPSGKRAHNRSLPSEEELKRKAEERGAALADARYAETSLSSCSAGHEEEADLREEPGSTDFVTERRTRNVGKDATVAPAALARLPWQVRPSARDLADLAEKYADWPEDELVEAVAAVLADTEAVNRRYSTARRPRDPAQPLDPRFFATEMGAKELVARRAALRAAREREEADRLAAEEWERTRPEREARQAAERQRAHEVAQLDRAIRDSLPEDVRDLLAHGLAKRFAAHLDEHTRESVIAYATWLVPAALESRYDVVRGRLAVVEPVEAIRSWIAEHQAEYRAGKACLLAPRAIATAA